MRAGPREAARDFVASGNLFLNLFLNRKSLIGKSSPHHSKNIFQAFELRPLAGKRDLLNDVLPHEVLSRIDVSLCDHFVGEPADGSVALTCMREALLVSFHR